MERLFGNGFRSLKCSISPVSLVFNSDENGAFRKLSSDVLNEGKAEKLEI